MKKVLLIAAVASLATVSCKKDRTCECTVTPNNGTAYTTSNKMYKVTKGEALEQCIGGQTTTVYSGTTNVGSNYDCKLK